MSTRLATRTDLALDFPALDKLMPMNVRLDGAGRILGFGPTMAKLFPAISLIGTSFFSIFEIRRPAGLTSMAQLRARSGMKMHLALTATEPAVTFTGLALPVAEGQGMILNLSFGIAVIEAIQKHTLTNSDFAATDLTVEVLYLMETKTVAMGALRQLATRLEGDKRHAQSLALTDPLTGLCNRRALELALDKQARSAAPFALMHLDLDYFKAVNDTYGHAAGDHVLMSVAASLRAELRVLDTVARFGGDEFVVLLPEMIHGADLQATASRIIAKLEEPIYFDNQHCRISASIGISLSTSYGVPIPAEMLADADEALYLSKNTGRGRSHLHAPTTQDRRRV